MLQVQGLSLDGHGVRFGCCPGHGFAICAGPAAQRLKRYSQIMLMISAPEGKGWGDDDYLFIAGERSDSPGVLPKQKCTRRALQGCKLKLEAFVKL